VRLKIAVEDVVVPEAASSDGRPELEGQGPPTGTGGGIGLQGVLLVVVIPAAGHLAGLDVGGSAEAEGGSSGGGRHDDGIEIKLLGKYGENWFSRV